MGKSARWIKKILGLKKKSSPKDKTTTPTKPAEKTPTKTADSECVVPKPVLNEVPQVVPVRQPTPIEPLPAKKEDLPAKPVLLDRQIQCTDESINEPIDQVNRDDQELDVVDDDMFQKVISKEDLAAVKIQKGFRSYLARRALHALRGLIRLQALARGHGVRKESAAALKCVQAVVRVQAVFRGRQVRQSEEGRAIQFLLQRYRQHTEDSWQIADQKPYKGIYRVSSNTKNADQAMQRQREWKKPRNQTPYIDSALETGSGWGWLQRWTSARPWALTDDAMLDISPRSGAGRELPTPTKPSAPHPTDPTPNNVDKEETFSTPKLSSHSLAPEAQETIEAPAEYTDEKTISDRLPIDDDTPELYDATDTLPSENGYGNEHEQADPEESNGHARHYTKEDQDQDDEQDREQDPTTIIPDDDDNNGRHRHLDEDKDEDDDDEDTNPDPAEESIKQQQQGSYFSPKLEIFDNAGGGRRARVPSYMAATQSAKAKARGQSPKSSSPTNKRRFSVPGPHSKAEAPPRRLSLPGMNGDDASPRRHSVSSNGRLPELVRSPQPRGSGPGSIGKAAAAAAAAAALKGDGGVRRSTEMRRSFKF